MTILCCQVKFFLRILWAFCPLYTDLWITVEAKDVIECVYIVASIFAIYLLLTFWHFLVMVYSAPSSCVTEAAF